MTSPRASRFLTGSAPLPPPRPKIWPNSLRSRELDPAKNLCFQDWTGSSFRGNDLRGFDFTGARLLACDFTDARITGARFDKAEIARVGFKSATSTNLRAARDWNKFVAGWRQPRKVRVSDRHLRPGTVFQDAPFAPELVVIPAGRFMMGSPDDEPGRVWIEGPRHEVTIPHALAVGRYPVTFEEWDFAQDDKDWASVTGIKPRKPNDRKWGRGGRPAIDVSWEDAKAYVKWLAHRTGEAYRLLSEAEWEYACRARSDAAWCFGGDESLLSNYAWFWDNSDQRIQPVGEKTPNVFGLHDMHGNVWELCEDVWHDSYKDKPAKLNRVGEAWSGHVVRGGSWNNFPEFLRAAYRRSSGPDGRVYVTGFRLARTLDT